MSPGHRNPDGKTEDGEKDVVFVSNFLSYRLKLQVLFNTAVKRKLQDLETPVI